MPSNSTTQQYLEKKSTTPTSRHCTRGSTKPANTLWELSSTLKIKISIIRSELPKSMFFPPTNCTTPSCLTGTVVNWSFPSAGVVSKKKMTCRSPSGRSIHWATRTHGKQVPVWQASCILLRLRQSWSYQYTGGLSHMNSVKWPPTGVGRSWDE